MKLNIKLEIFSDMFRMVHGGEKRLAPTNYFYMELDQKSKTKKFKEMIEMMVRDDLL